MIELLAITDDPTPPEAPLRAVRCDGVSVLCAPAREGEPDAEALWEREALLERLMEDRDLLPVRFGTVVADERAAAEAVSPRSEDFARALERVRGAVELSVRAVGSDPGGVDALHEQLAALARDSVVLEGPDALRAAYLVGRGEVDAFVERFRALQRSHRELSLVCTGPWPPYSFAERREP